MGVSLAYRITFHDNTAATIREGAWADLPATTVQIVRVYDVTKGRRKLLARISGFDNYFAGADRFGGWNDDPARFKVDGGTPIMDPYTPQQRARFFRLGLDPADFETVPGGVPGRLWNISRRGAVSYGGDIAGFPVGTRPPETVGAKVKRGSLIDDDKARALGLAVRWREWLIREGRS